MNIHHRATRLVKSIVVLLIVWAREAIGLRFVGMEVPRVLFLVLEKRFPPLSDVHCDWDPERYGKLATSWLDESRLRAVRKVSDVLRCPSSCWVLAFHWC
jgi:hypothetical protein